MSGMQALLHLVYPPQCICCDALVTKDFAMCGPCWVSTPFISGLVCDLCGVPLPGDEVDRPVHCDDCLRVARPWSQGRAATLYRDNARDLILQLKHSDRVDLAVSAGAWLYRAAAPILQPDMLLAPIPLYWLRLLRRKYNQSALLCSALARRSGLPHCPDLLIRTRNTGSQEGRDREGRFRNMSGAIELRASHAGAVRNRHVLLIDDVMTSGATFAAATEACLSAGAKRVSVLALSRVAKES